VPCVVLDHLTETQRRAYVLADNRLGEIGGGWDAEMLKLEVEDLGEALDGLGFSAEEMEGLGAGPDPDFAPGTEDEQGKLDEKTPIECPHCHRFFTP